MNAHATISESTAPQPRHDGWTPERRRDFLEAIASGLNVDAACRQVGLSRASAYALRNRDAGFALGWSGAYLRARDALADILTSRALDGQVETWTRPDGTEGSRRRYDNRLAMALLARLDRLVEQPGDRSRIDQPTEEAARGVAHDLGGFLDLIERDEADDATVERFVDMQICKVRQLRSEDRLRAIERAARPGYDHPADAPDPSDPSDDEEGDVDDEEHEDEEEVENEDDASVTWFELSTWEWRTSLPPPPDFYGYEVGCFGQRHYWRVLTDAERDAAQAEMATVPGFCRAPVTAPLPPTQADPTVTPAEEPVVEAPTEVIRYAAPLRRPRTDWVV